MLSSFHANSTSAAFARMIDLIGVNPIFASSIRLVVAQRLVRKLSPSKRARKATEAEAEYIRKVLSGVDRKWLEGDVQKPRIPVAGPASKDSGKVKNADKLTAEEKADKIMMETDLNKALIEVEEKIAHEKNEEDPVQKATAEVKVRMGKTEYGEKMPSGKIDLDDIVLYDPVPTEEEPFGYSGRTVIMEQLVVSEDIQAFIRGDVTDINTDAIEKAARKNGMLTLEQKGVLAALRGETTLEEISRVI